MYFLLHECILLRCEWKLLHLVARSIRIMIPLPFEVTDFVTFKIFLKLTLILHEFVEIMLTFCIDSD